MQQATPIPTTTITGHLCVIKHSETPGVFGFSLDGSRESAFLDSATNLETDRVIETIGYQPTDLESLHRLGNLYSSFVGSILPAHDFVGESRNLKAWLRSKAFQASTQR